MNLQQAVDCLKAVRAKDPKVFMKRGTVSLKVSHPDISVTIPNSLTAWNAMILDCWEERLGCTQEDKKPWLRGFVGGYSYKGTITSITFDEKGVIYHIHPNLI